MHPPALQTTSRGLGDEVRGILRVLLYFLAFLWAVEIADVTCFGGALDHYGVMPRTPLGLLGIAFAPFLHGDFAHLAGNTIGIVLLGGLTLMVGRREFFWVTATGVVIGGLGTWVFGRSAVHIGASGLVFAYLGFLLMRGWYDRRPGPILLALMVGWWQGGLVLGMIPGITPSHISWEGHLFGFVAGAVVANLWARRQRRLAHA